jgi:tRNA modification GTPase
LIDTAGIREHTLDIIESIGMERSLEKMRQADVVLYLFDVNETDATELKVVEENFKKTGIVHLFIGNKTEHSGTEIKQKFAPVFPIVYVSAKENLGIDELKKALVRVAVSGDINTEGVVVTNTRHYEALQNLRVALRDVRKGLNENIPGDLLSPDIRQCLYYLGTITGEVTTEDQLDYIFSKFCIGK